MRGTRDWRRSAAALAVLPVIALAACGGDDSDESSAGGEQAACKPTGGKVALSFWSWVPGIEKAVEVWNEQNPDIQVKLRRRRPATQDATRRCSTPSRRARRRTSPRSGSTAAQLPPPERLRGRLGLLGGPRPSRSSCRGPGRRPASAAQACSPSRRTPARWPSSCAATSSRSTASPIPKTWDEYAADAQKLHKADPSSPSRSSTRTTPSGSTDSSGRTTPRCTLLRRQVARHRRRRTRASRSPTYWQKLIDAKLVRTDLANGSTQMYAAYQKNQIAT